MNIIGKWKSFTVIDKSSLAVIPYANYYIIEFHSNGEFSVWVQGSKLTATRKTWEIHGDKIHVYQHENGFKLLWMTGEYDASGPNIEMEDDNSLVYYKRKGIFG